MAAPHKNSSFSYKTIHPNIRAILDNRSRLNNTVQMSMPFVKVTSTLNMNGIHGTGNIGFTLGLHAIPEDVRAQNIYSDSGGNALIGYTYDVDGRTERVYAQVNEDTELLTKFFDKGANLYSSDTKFSHIPPPGITSVTIGSIKNGVVSSAQIEITVPTLPQLEMLHKTFLVPGLGMVVEWGQQFSRQLPDLSEDAGENGLTAEGFGNFMFPWHNRTQLVDILKRLAGNEIGTEEIVNCYAHPTQGQYQWIFGRVANFNVKSNGDGSFNCSVKIVGPAENAWAYSVKNTVIPATATRGGPICINGVNSVEDYFTKTTSPGVPANFKSLLEGVKNGSILPNWQTHVQYFANGNKKGGEADNTSANVDQSSFGDSEDAYFITWRFFVNVVLNHKDYGLQSIFQNAGLLPSDLAKTRVIRPYGDPNSLDTPGEMFIDDPYETFVGNNQYLRSTDPSTLIIVNETAADLLSQFLVNNRPELLSTGREGGFSRFFGLGTGLTTETDESRKFKDAGDFQKSDSLLSDARSANNDRGFLSTGVWLNHKAIIQTMLGADTIATGLSNLLNRMNAATLNYWQLTLDVSEPLTPNVCTGMAGDTASPPTAFSYTVVDMNYKENAQTAVRNFLDNVHIFNRYIKSDNGNLVGSDVLDCSVDINLPKRLFSQIATMGLVQGDDVNEGAGSTTKVGDPNDTLRKMFAITQVGRDANGQSPDFTAPILDRSGAVSGACGGTVTPLPAGTAGQGTSATPTPAGAATQDRYLEIDVNRANSILNAAPCNTTCAAEVAGATSSPPPPVDITGVPQQQFSGNVLPINANVRSQWQGKGVQYARTCLSFEEAFTHLQNMGCSDALTLSVMASMYTEQPARSACGGPDFGYQAFNYNFSGVDLRSAWQFNPIYHNGWTTATEGGTQKRVPYASFHDAYRHLHFKASRFKQRADDPSKWLRFRGNTIKLDQERVLTPEEFALLYYIRWNGCGFRDALQVKDGLTGTPWSQCANGTGRGQKYEYPSSRADFQAWDARGQQNAANAYRKIYNLFQSKLSGRKQTDIRAITGPIPASPARVVTNPTTPSTETASPGPPPAGTAAGGSLGTSARATTEPSLFRRGLESVANLFNNPDADRLLAERRAANAAAGVGQNSTASATGAVNPNVLVTQDALKLVRGNTDVTSPITCTDCIRAKRISQQRSTQLAANRELDAAAAAIPRQFPGLEGLFRYIEPFGTLMLANITNNADGDLSNAFGASPGSLSINVDLTLPGISGLRVGQLFWLDRIPAFYRAFGAFQIISIEDSIATDGWKTKISAKFNYMGVAWKNAVAAKLSLQ